MMISSVKRARGIALGFVAPALAGYGVGVGDRRSWLHVLSDAAVTAVVVFVILDLEYPRLGFIRTVSCDNAISSPLGTESRGTLIVKGLLNTERACANGLSGGIRLDEGSGEEPMAFVTRLSFLDEVAHEDATKCGDMLCAGLLSNVRGRIRLSERIERQ